MTGTALYFSAEWCGPCKPFKPVAMAALDNAGIQVIEYDADTAFEETTKFGVRSLPTIILQKDNVEIARVTGASHKQLGEALQRFKNG